VTRADRALLFPPVIQIPRVSPPFTLKKQQMNIVHPSHAPHSVPGLHAFPDRLHVVTAIANPSRFLSRYRLYRAFEKMVADSGATLWTVEAAFGGRPFEVTTAGNPWHVQVRSSDELWYKENLLNIGISRIPEDARYIAVVDADFLFTRPDWAQETLQQLQHHPVVQMFSSVTYLDPVNEPINTRVGFAERWLRGEEFQTQKGVVRNPIFHHPRKHSFVASGDYVDEGEKIVASKPSSEWGPPGGAWAYRREALDEVGGLIDFCILGSADWFMAAGKAGFMADAIPAAYSAPFAAQLIAWGNRAEKAFRKDIGVVNGGAIHYWHGKMKERRYGERESILKACAFNPLTDLRKDSQGLFRLRYDGSDRHVRLRDDIRAYFRSRNEDSIDS